MIDRLLRNEKNKNPADDLKKKMEEFLKPTSKVVENEKPTIIQFYKDTFNEVDLFDKLLALINFPYSIYNKKLVFFINLLLISVINSYALFSEIQNSERVEDIKVPLKQFIIILSKQLLNKK